MFNLREAAIFQAVKWERNPVFRWARTLKKLFLILFILDFGLFLYFLIFEKYPASKLKGLALIFLAFTLINWLSESFFNSKLKKPRLRAKIEEAINRPDEYNLAEFLSFEVAEAVDSSIKFAQSKKLSEINSSILFYFLISENPKLNFVFARALLSPKEIKKILEPHFKILKSTNVDVRRQQIYSEDFQETILDSLKIAQEKGHQRHERGEAERSVEMSEAHRRVEIGDVITALAKNDLIFKKILIEANLKFEDIENLTWWLENLEEKIEEQKRFWELESLMKIGSIGKEWAAGYTLTLDRFSIDLTETVKRQGFLEIIGHQKEIKEMERILSRRESNNDVLIVGQAGSGRKSMIQALAEKSVLGKSLPEINYKRIVQLDLSSLLVQVQSIEEVEEILDRIFREVVYAKNVILVIDEFHNFIGLPGIPQPGKIDISGVISQYLALPQFQIVAITTFEGLHQNIEQNSSILNLFEKVEVSEISQRETLRLLENLALKLESQHKILISYPAIKNIISLCDKYFQAIPFPEKAMDLIEEVMVYVSQGGEKIISSEHVSKVVSQKTQIPVGEIEIKEREILLNLENLIHQRIINQEEAVNEVSAALRRARAEISVRKGPMGSFLFLGPTGVGKTETAKALAEIYFGSENKMVRLDMSEFQNKEDIKRFLGKRGEEGILTTPVMENPFSLVLLDEFEKAHPDLLNLFLQVLDEGHLTDGQGRKIGFKNTIIIATSNAAYQIILEALKQKTEWSKVREKLLDFVFKEGIFRPELINRFDAVVVFGPLSKENLLDISELLLKKIKKSLAEKEIEFIITPVLKEKIVELSYDPTFGARKMQRVIQDKLGNVLAEAILSDKLKRGYKVEIEPEEFKLIINP